MKTMMLYFGSEMTPYLHVGAFVAIGIAQRKGLGRVRHLDTQALWIQDAVREKRVYLEKVPGAENPSDLMTKHVDGNLLTKMINLLHMTVMKGRATTAPELVKENGGP